MSVKTISVEDLMAECNVSDRAEFRRLLKSRRLAISLNKPVKREDANKISRAFTGKAIDWFKYEQRERDSIYEGPLKKKPSVGSDRIEGWYQKLPTHNHNPLQSRDCLIGLVFTGGFLGGTDGNEFVLGLVPGINILIGDRGSGKSTVLNLLSLVSGSVSEETNILINKLLNLLKDYTEEIEVTRQVRRALKQYGVDAYACYYIINKKLICYYVDIHETAYDFLERNDGEWFSLQGGIPRPRMQALLQGEVIKIAEEREKYYLNNFLDSLFPDLYQKREELTKTIKKVATQSEFYRQKSFSINTYRIDLFIENRYKELRSILRDIRRGSFTGDSIQLISNYIKRIHGIDRRALPPTISQLLRQEEEDAYYQLYLGRVVPFLVAMADQVESLRQKKSAFLEDELYSKFDDVWSLGEGILDPELMEELNADKEVLAEIEDSDVSSQGTEPLLPTNQASLFLEAIEIESNNPINRQLLNVGRRIVDLLETRLRILRTWSRIFARPRLEWTMSLEALIDSCIQLLGQRVELITLQEKKCDQVKKILNDDQFEISIFTRGAKGDLAEHQRDINGLRKLSALYKKLFSATPMVRLSELQKASVECDEHLHRLQTVLKTVNNVIETNQQHEFLFIPVEIDLRQGGVYRNFSQLSFGQKSGIILNMVLLTTREGIIIIDQPEDNLDANSITTLVPILNRLAKRRQIIIATHNSNLVLALKTLNTVVLESRGESGKIKTSGSPMRSKDLVLEMLDILEGGIETFDLKMKTYEEFISRVRGEIQDINIQLIESSFRRRTIDNLRNILQPIVSDQSILEFARHELRNVIHPIISGESILDATRRELRQPGNIAVDETAAPQETLSDGSHSEHTGMKLMESLDKLLSELDTHIERLMAAINDISLMDTQPQPKDADLYELLAELKDDYVERISRSRIIQIDVDERLKGRKVFSDVDHLKLVFKNLLNNSLRATEKKVLWNFRRKRPLVESIAIKLLDDSDGRLTLLFMDNGCGIPPEMKGKLYVERCSDQAGKEHGLGGVIIRKLLDLNGGTIRVLDDPQTNDGFVTFQQLTLSMSQTKAATDYE